jgi:hypothetical protein
MTTEPSRVRAEILATLTGSSTQWDERTGDEPTSKPYLEYLAEGVEDLWDTWHHEVVIPLRNDVATLRQQLTEREVNLQVALAKLEPTAPYGITPDEYDHEDVVTAQALVAALAPEWDPNDGWDYDVIGPLLRTMIAVLTTRRAELEPRVFRRGDPEPEGVESASPPRSGVQPEEAS